MPEPWETDQKIYCPAGHTYWVAYTTLEAWRRNGSVRQLVGAERRGPHKEYSRWERPCNEHLPGYHAIVEVRAEQDAPQPPSLEERKVGAIEQIAAALERIATVLEQLLERSK